MKKLLNVFAAIAMTLVVIGGVFKVNHWPLTGLVLLLSMGFTALLFLPLLMVVRTRDAKGGKMKVINCLGFLALSLLMMGILFKIMHWPLAGVMLVFALGIPSLFVFPVLGFHRAKHASTRGEKTLNIFGFLYISCFTLGLLGKIMHWPGATLMFALSIILLIVATVGFFRSMRDNPEKKNALSVNVAIVTIFISTIVTLSVTNVSNALLNSIAIIEDGILESTENIEEKNEMSYQFIPEIQGNDKFVTKAMKLKEISDELVNYIADMKSMLISQVDGMSKENADSIDLVEVNGKDNYDFPTRQLIGDVENPREGNFSGRELKNRIIVYRKDALGLLDPTNGRLIGEEIGLQVNDRFDPEMQIKVSWEVYEFDHVPLASVIAILSQLQYQVRYSQTTILRQLSLVHNAQLITGVVADVKPE